MRKHCGNCANHKKETNQFSDECGKCVAAVLENGEHTEPSHWREKPQTNADRIRAMSDEELISFFVLEDKCPKNISRRECDGFESCKDCWIHWLKQPAEVDNGQA